MDADIEPIDLAAAARDLEVHYQTAYRWVRTGRLPAVMVDGKYVLKRRDVDALRRARRKPSRPKPPGRPDVSARSEGIRQALIAGEEQRVRQLVGDLVDRGANLREVMTLALAPALREIGEEWRAGRLAISTEHRATAIADRLLGELAPNPRGRRRGTVVVAAIDGDRHALPTTMAALALREENWIVHHLGSDLPAAELRTFCRTETVDLVVITVTEPEVGDAAQAAASSIRALGIPVIVGGPGRTLEELVTSARAAGNEAASTGTRR